MSDVQPAAATPSSGAHTPDLRSSFPATVTLAVAPVEQSPPRSSLADLANALKLLASTVVWVILAGLLAWFALNGTLGRFLGSIDVSQIEAFGVKMSVNPQKRDLLRKLKADESAKARKGDNAFYVDSEAILQALKRAEINAGAVQGARLLWVDDEPENNTIVVDLLSEIGVNVVAVTNNAEALARLRAAEAHGQSFDAIVTDGSRPEDEQGRSPVRSMGSCKPTYFAKRTVSQESSHLIKLSEEEAAERNRKVEGGLVVGGFRLAEDVAGAPELARYTAIAAPRLIMYSASNGDISYSPCFRSITRDTATLFHALISVVEESRPPIVVVAPSKDGPEVRNENR